jgi:hypothetical protein
MPVGTTVTISRLPARNIVVSSPAVPVLVKSRPKQLDASQGSVATVARIPGGRVLSASVGQTALLARLPKRFLTVTVTAVPSVSNTGIATVLLFVRQPVGHSSLSPLV